MNYEQSNWLIDTVMPDVKEANAFKVIAAVARSTWGWNREWHDMSFNDLQGITGISSRETLTKAVKDALKSGYIRREKWGKSYRYAICSPESVPDYVNNQSDNRTGDSPESVPETSPESVPSSIKEKKRGKPKKQKERDCPVPFQLATPEFLNVWGEWQQYHTEHGRPLTFTTTKKQLDQLVKYPVNVAAAMVEQSITNNWKGIFEIKANSNGRHPAATKKDTGIPQVDWTG